MNRYTDQTPLEASSEAPSIQVDVRRILSPASTGTQRVLGALNAPALAQRTDIGTVNKPLQKDIASKGRVLNKPDSGPFLRKLRSAGYYTDRKAKFSKDAWFILERSIGKLG